MTQEEKELVLSYLPLVQQIAYRLQRHLPSSVDVNDLIGYGVLALIEALPRIDRSKNPMAYLKLRVRGAMYDYLRSLDFVSRNIRSKEKVIKQALKQLSMERGEEVSDEELAEFLGGRAEKLEGTLKAITST
ncbi:MAG: sigma-70 family RNA polymerase sigma factor [Aquificaceae bacterium]